MYATLLEALEASARTDKGIHFVESAQQHYFLSYRQLHRDALGLLAGLQKRGVRAGDELVLQYADLKGLVTAYWACLAGGIVPVPLEYADKPANAEKVLTVWPVLADAWLATDCDKLAGKLEKFALETGYTEQWGRVRERLVFPQREQADPESCRIAAIAPDDIAFIQFSSGSTGAPKGVALTHANLLTNIGDLLAAMGHGADDCFLSWKPITHDFGMIAFHLAPIVGGSEQVRIATDAFIWNPSLWFSMASKFGATILGSPNFGYRHLLKLYRRNRSKRSDWDLSRVRVVLNGAEPISAQLCDEFASEFAEYGLPATAMRCGYGLAEGSLAVSLCPLGEPVRTVAVDRRRLGVGERLREVDPAAPEAMSLVDCGFALARTEIRITGAGRAPLPEGHVGHIEIRGGAVTAGYYRNADASAELISPDGWLDTQDLGALRGGRLVVVGRLKEMIICGGVNYFPHDIEQAILRAKGESALNKFIACGVYNPDRGSEDPLVFVHHKPGDGNFAALAAEVRQLVLAAFGLPVAHVVPVRRIPKTTSGKVQRFKLLRDFLAGEFDAALGELGETRVSGAREASPTASAAVTAAQDEHALPGHADIVDRTRRIVARLLGQDQVEVDARFMDLGLSSLRLLTLREQLEQEFGVALDSTSALDFPSVRSLAAYIARSSAGATVPAHTTPRAAEPVTDAGRDAVAIVGMACRFPGGAHSPEAFWELLSSGQDPVGEVPAERWRNDPHAGAEVTTRQGGFLDSVDRFDPLFFGISPAEAQAIDPQQRLLLEVCHEAIENSGRSPKDLAGTRTGVFVGISGSDYAHVGKDLGHGTGPYTFTGTMFNTAAGRVSYTFGLQGPSVAVDTACSSSLVAVYQGLRELRAGSCDLVLAGGVSLMLKIDGHVSFSRLNALAASGRCRSFDDNADGYVRGEGCGVVVLKRLRDAERDGDPILAVILGAAVNHNGASGGLTVPSGPAQERLIAQALQDAGVAPADIDYVEAHGSGTRLGDPQELNALARVFAGRDRRLVLGSVKSNLGHLESAAGVAGLIKLVLCLRNRQFAPNLHFRTPNALADWCKVPFQVAAELLPWEARREVRTAGISSFGINGTNAHLIVREYQAPAPQATAGRTDGSFVFTLAAKSRAGLEQTARAFAEHPQLDAIPFHALCQTVNRLRASHPVRFACAATNAEELKRKLLRLAAEDKTGLSAAQTPQPAAEGPVFLYTGQGSCYAGIGRRLYEQNRVFQRAFDRCDELFSALIGASLQERAYGPGAHPLQDQRIAQALIFTVEYALARVWESLGVRPVAVIGHSIGEYAAACEAGIVSLEEAVCMVALRGAIMQGTPAEGAMAGVLADEASVRALCDAHSDVYVAAVNAPENITIAGRQESVAKLVAQARKQRIFTEAMPMAHAFHSPLMRASAAKLEEGLQGIRFAPPRIAFISTQTGAAIGSAGDIGRSYWSAHLCNPVRFRAALQVALEGGARTFVEIGGTATLSGLGAQNAADPGIAFLPSLRESRDAWEQLNESIAALFQRGHAIDWDAYHGGHYTFVAGLPNTGYHRTRCWYPDTERSADLTACALTVETAPVAAGEACAPAGASVCASSIEPVAVEAVAAEPVAIEAEAVKSEIKGMVSRVTGVAPSEISDHVHLFSLGVDSLMLVQLDKQVIARYRVDIPLKRFFTDLHTPDKIAAYVYAEMPRELRTAHAQPSLPVAVLPPAPTPQAHSAAQALPADVPADVQAIVHAQLDIMREQLALLRGGASNNAVVPAGHRPRSTDRGAGAGVQPAARAKTNLRDITLHEEDVNAEQLAFVRDLVSRVNRMTPQSKDYAQRHRAGFADWIATLNFTLTMKELAYPIVSTRSRGARIWDIDGNEYIDTAIGYGVSFFGHNPDFIVEALGEQLQQGIELGPQSPLAGEVAELVRSLTGVERVAFCNTGTEAVMVALRLARTVTRRSKIVRFITSFHGSFDGVLAEASESGPVPMAPGIPQSMVDDTVVLHYGSPESLETIRAMGEELAAVLVEPVQSRNPGLQPREYLQDLRRITAQAGIALIFDEMVTGFRIHPGGAQAYFGVRADLVTYGKIVGGGMPIGIVAGRADYLDAIDGGTWNFNDASGPSKETTFFAGTFCKHPLAMAAARAVLKKLAAEGPALIDGVSELTRRFVDEVNAFCQAEGVPMQVKRFGSMYRFETRVSRDLPRLSLEMNLFFRLMLLHGIYVWERRTCFFSTAHTEEDAQRILHAVKQSVCELRAGGFSFRVAAGPDGDGPRSSAAERRVTLLRPRDAFPLSSEERRVYVLSQMRGGEAAYHVTGALRIDGDLDAAKVEDVLRALAARHEALRTAYAIEDGEIVHRVRDDVAVALEQYQSTEADLPATIARVVRPFQLAQAPLWRIGLIGCGSACHVLVFDFHHLIADGTSMSILIEEFLALYQGGELAPVASTYADFVAWEGALAAGTELKCQKDYWRQQLEPLPAPLALPCDFPRPPHNDFAGFSVHFALAADTTRAVRELAKQAKATPFMVLLAAYFAFLHKLTQHNDLCVGTPFDRRSTGAFDGTVGMFAQTLVIRAGADGATRFAELLATVKQACTSAYAHADCPLDELLQELAVPRDFSRNPLFDTLFIYERGDRRVFRTDRLRAQTLPVDAGGAAFDLTLEIVEEDEVLRCSFIAARRLFAEPTVRRWASQFGNLLSGALALPATPLSELQIESDEERDRLLRAFNATERTYPADATVHSLFRESAARFPQRVAVRFDDREMSYAQLDGAADALAQRLCAAGVAAGDRVGILLRRGPSLIVSMLATLKAGAAYVPLDPDYPAARLRYMLESSAAKAVLGKAELAASLGFHGTLIDPDAQGDSGDAAPAGTAGPADLAYVIFTSGSTGRPKGVMIEHRNVVNFIHGMREALALPEHPVTLGLTTISFDIFVLEVFLTLAAGGTLVLAPEAIQRDPQGLTELIQRTGACVVQITPSRLQMLLASQPAQRVFSGVRVLLVGGEAFPAQSLPVLKTVEGLRIFNVYGPTETTVWSSLKELSSTDRITLGKPIANTRMYVLGASEELLPAGCVGDLYIAGAGLARGYLNDEGATAAAFRPDPFVPGERMYRTGDHAAWTADGELVYHGRSDEQVKLRGYRIELAEIESVLRAHARVKNAAVAVRELGPGNPVLVAYCVPAAGTLGAQGEAGYGEALRTYVAQHLPEHMVPAVVVAMETLPSTPNGKIDRNALPAPVSAPPAAVPATEDAADELEAQIVQAWKQVLGERPIGPRDSFFDVGGNSLSLVLMHSALAQKYPGVLEVADVFANPTVAALKRHLQDRLAAGERAGKELVFPSEFFRAPPQPAAAHSLHVELAADWAQRIHTAALAQGCDASELALAVYLLYLNKLLEADTVAMPAAFDRNAGYVPVEIDFRSVQGLGAIVRMLQTQRGSSTARMQPPVCRRAHERGVLSLFASGGSAGPIERHGFDLVLQVGCGADRLRIELACDCGRLSEARLQRFLADYVKLIKVVVGAAAAPAPGNTEPVALRAA